MDLELPEENIAQKKYSKTEKGKLAKKRYFESPKGKAAIKRYQNSEKGKEAKLKREESRKVILSLMSRLEKFCKDNPSLTTKEAVKKFLEEDNK